MKEEPITSVEELPFEDGITELEDIVRNLEQKEVPLEEALNLFKKGIELVQHCNKLLDHAEKEMQILLEDSNGDLIIHPADFPVEG